MSETNEKSSILNSLEYIGLDLDNIPDFLMEYEDVDYKPTKAYEQTDFKVYRYIHLKDIQILLTPTNRLNTITEKYSKAIPICEYLDNKNEENILNYTKFLKMLESLNPKEIDKIDNEQKQMKDKVPFRVKYDTNYLWEIYYSEFTGKYFMLVTTEDQDYNALFYLLKRQIEAYKSNNDDLIFVPISYLDYTKRYLKKSEISDIEKYIWIFTKDWPKIYEVFDKENELTIHVVGITNVYDKVKSYYKIELPTKEITIKFLTLVKALFILRTELPNHYNFDTQINEKGELIFEFNNKVIDYNNLLKFIKEEYKKNSKELKKIFEEKEKLDLEVEKLKEEELEKNKEYLFREKQVATYLECRKSMFGKIKYFFKNKNSSFIKSKKQQSRSKQIKENNEIERSIANSIIEEKDIYTIEDLIKICIEFDRINLRIKDAKLDINALKDKIEIVKLKIKNATLFIQKIEDHKKSIFEFWKFANKDMALGLNAGETTKQEEKTKKIKRTFDYEEDIEDIGIEVDNIQRKAFDKEETNAIFLATTDEITNINKLRNKEEILEKDLRQNINKIKNNNNSNVFSINSFDIFGNIKNDKTKISVLANKRHRESEKDKNKILEISENTTLEDYKKVLEKNNKLINSALDKSKAITDIDIYLASSDKLNTKEIQMFYINPSDAINSIPELNKVSLYKIKVKEGMNLIYNTNIICYDNTNNTLPVGMNVANTVIFDMARYKIDVKKQTIFRINQDNNNFDFKEKIICAYEYEAK